MPLLATTQTVAREDYTPSNSMQAKHAISLEERLSDPEGQNASVGVVREVAIWHWRTQAPSGSEVRLGSQIATVRVTKSGNVAA
jgi:hypothetical protein